MNKKFLLGIIVPLLVGCGQQTPTGEGMITVKDMQNREVTIDLSNSNRIVCLGAGALRYYSYIGDMSKIVAVEEIDKTPFGVGTALRPYYHVNKDYFATLPTCGKGGPAAQSPDYEAILANNPNLIISFYSDASVNDEMASTLNVPVVALKQDKYGVFGSETLESFKLLGKVLNKENRANELINYVKAAENELSKLTINNTTCYAGCIGNWGKTDLFGSYNDFPVFKYARVKNVLEGLSDLAHDKQVTIDAEKLVQLNPEKIFLDGSGLAGFLGDYKQNKAKYTALDAIKNGETYILLPYNAYYTNLEIQMMSTYYVASVIHQSNFESFNIATKCNEILTAFLGKGNYDEMKEYSTSYGGYQKVNIENLINE